MNDLSKFVTTLLQRVQMRYAETQLIIQNLFLPSQKAHGFCVTSERRLHKCGGCMKYIEVIRESRQKTFVVIGGVLYFVTCFGQVGHPQVIYEMLWRKL